MRFLKLACVLVLVLVIGCSRNESTLIDFQKITARLPDSLMLDFVKNSDIYAVVKGPDRIVAITSGYRLESNDDMNSIGYDTGYPSVGLEQAYSNADATKFYSLYRSTGNASINYSNDRGKSFAHYSYQASGDYKEGYILNESIVYFVTYKVDNNVARFKFFKANTSIANSHVQVSEMIIGANSEPKGMCFLDENNGCYVYTVTTGGCWIAITHDAGVSWTTHLVSAENPSGGQYKVMMLGNGSYIVLHPDKNRIFRSNDEAVSWSTVYLMGTLVSLEIQNIGNGTLRASSSNVNDDFGDICNLYESDNGGATWTKKNTNPFYGTHVKFYDSLNGIAYSRGILQVTNDGGVTWERKLFPVKIL